MPLILKNALSNILNNEAKKCIVNHFEQIIEANVLRREQKQLQKDNEHVHVHIERIISSKKQLTSYR